jgi:3-oxoacyl-[acyl-carrier-protein] synthase III
VQVVEQALEKASLQKSDIDWLVLHQVGGCWCCTRWVGA